MPEGAVNRRGAPAERSEMKLRIRPLQDRVVVERIEEQEQMRGGIVIPDSAKEKPQEARVIAVGPGKIGDDGQRHPMDVAVGDRVLVGRYSGSDVKLAEEELVILREDEILAVLDSELPTKVAAQETDSEDKNEQPE